MTRMSGYTVPMSRLNTLIVLVLSLWLPVQGMAAVVMPFCKHSMVADESMMHEAHRPPVQGVNDHHGHSAEHAHAMPSGSDAASATLNACDDCGQCALSAASALPVAGLPTATIVATAPPDSFLPALAGTFPNRLNRPPLLA